MSKLCSLQLHCSCATCWAWGWFIQCQLKVSLLFKRLACCWIFLLRTRCAIVMEVCISHLQAWVNDTGLAVLAIDIGSRSVMMLGFSLFLACILYLIPVEYKSYYAYWVDRPCMGSNQHALWFIRSLIICTLQLATRRAASAASLESFLDPCMHGGGIEDWDQYTERLEQWLFIAFFVEIWEGLGSEGAVTKTSWVLSRFNTSGIVFENTGTSSV